MFSLRKFVCVPLLLLLGLGLLGNFPSQVKADANPPTFQELIEAGNPNEDSFGTDTTHHYYRNGTWQTEDWIYIKVNSTDVNGVDTVIVEWKNETQWYNYTMILEEGLYYINITDQPRYEGYTFNIWANDTLGNMGKIYNWTFYDYEVAWGTEEEWRKYVGLNATTADFSYEQFYVNKFGYEASKTNDRSLPHEQPTDGSTVDTGHFTSLQPTTNQEVWCNSFVGVHIDETFEINVTTITNLYVHIWWGSNFTYGGNVSTFGYEKERDAQMEGNFDESYNKDFNDAMRNITLSGFHQSTYFLEAKYWNINDPNYSDNDINLFTFKISDTSDKPSIISTPNYSSFIIFNLPDNSTLQSLDTDSDGLNDYQELYIYHTDPKDSDTDGGGVNDGEDFIFDPLDPNDESLAIYNIQLKADANPYLVNSTAMITALNYETGLLNFTVSATSGLTSTTQVHSGDKGEPTSVSGASSWSYNTTSKILTIRATHSSPITITVEWIWSPERMHGEMRARGKSKN